MFAIAGYGLVVSVPDYRAGEELTAPLVYVGVAVIREIVLDV